MRHGESGNNLLAKISYQLYNEKRVAEPELSPEGVLQCFAVGQYLKRTGIKIDEFICSAHKRAILSALEVIKGSEQAPLSLMVLIHERGGMFFKNEVTTGLTKQEVLTLAPEIKINDTEIGENGWYKLDH